MHYFLLFSMAVFFSCSEMGKNSAEAPSSDVSVSKVSDPKSDSFAIKFSFLRNLPIKMPPFKDSTSFDNFKFSALLSPEQQFRYELGSMVSPYDIKDINSSEMRYRVPLSDEFVTIVFTTQIGEHEMRTDLANFDSNFRLIDFKTIAYDEIAEGCLRKSGAITGDKIIIYEANYCDEDTAVHEKIVQMDGSGKMKPVQ